MSNTTDHSMNIFVSKNKKLMPEANSLVCVFYKNNLLLINNEIPKYRDLINHTTENFEFISFEHLKLRTKP